MVELDAKGAKISAGAIANAYRMVVPKLAPARHVTVRIHPNRWAELAPQASKSDLSDMVEIGTFSEGPSGRSRSVTRLAAVPDEVHPKDGVELVLSETVGIRTVSFDVNGIPALQLVNLAVTSPELKAEADAKKAQDDADKLAQQKVFDDQLEQAKKDAFEKGRMAAVLEQAEAAGKASVKDPGKTQ